MLASYVDSQLLTIFVKIPLNSLLVKSTFLLNIAQPIVITVYSKCLLEWFRICIKRFWVENH